MKQSEYKYCAEKLHEAYCSYPDMEKTWAYPKIGSGDSVLHEGVDVSTLTKNLFFSMPLNKKHLPCMLEMLREIKPKSLFCKQRFGQAVFDEFMKVPSLEQVCFRSPLSIDNIEGLCELPNLKLFNMSGANKLLSFEPLAKLKLKKLALNGTYASIEQLSSIKLPEGLEALSFSGTGNKKSVIEDLEFVAECASLKFVALFQLTVVNGGLKPLARLNNLEYLSLDDYRLKDWSLEDYKYIHSRLPQLNPITIKLAATDEEFQKHHRIR